MFNIIYGIRIQQKNEVLQHKDVFPPLVPVGHRPKGALEVSSLLRARDHRVSEMQEQGFVQNSVAHDAVFSMGRINPWATMDPAEEMQIAAPDAEAVSILEAGAGLRDQMAPERRYPWDPMANPQV